MNINKNICDMQIGEEIEGYYILRGVMPKIASNGKPFLNLSIADKTGTLDAKVWDYSGPIGVAEEGKVAWLRGNLSEFRGAAQLTIDRIRTLELNDRVDVTRLVPVAPVDRNEMYDEVLTLLDSIEDDDYRRISKKLLERHEKGFRNIPAAKSVHHSFLSGLLMHTANMMKAANFYADLYPKTINRSLLLAGTFAHDLEKETEFTFSELGLAVDYSMKGQLIGHLVMGAQEIAEVAREVGIPEEKSVLLQHLVLSHHGQPEYGAAVTPICAESELLSYIDLIDSRMEIYAENLENMEPGDFSGRIFALEKKIYKHN